MNREQRRKAKKKLSKMKFKNVDKEIYLPEGTKVKLNLKKIKEHPDYKSFTEEYKNFIEDNKDKIFTVEYDRYRKNPSTLVCLKEDPTPLKWLFWVGYLIEVKEENIKN